MTAQPEEEEGWIPEDTLALRLFLVRRKLKLSQREAAVRTGVPYGSWQSMEDGRDARGVDWKVNQISEALGVNRDWLMWGGPKPQTRATKPASDLLPRLDSNQQPAGLPFSQVSGVFRSPFRLSERFDRIAPVACEARGAVVMLDSRRRSARRDPIRTPSGSDMITFPQVTSVRAA